MRGTVFHYDEDQDYGYINGVDGKRYIFTREDVGQGVSLARRACRVSGGRQDGARYRRRNDSSQRYAAVTRGPTATAWPFRRKPAGPIDGLVGLFPACAGR